MNMKNKNKKIPKNMCDCENNNKCNDYDHDIHEDIHNTENIDDQTHNEEICNHDHVDDGCSCEEGMLENIDKEKQKDTKKPLLILGIGAIIFIFGYYISTLDSNIFGSISNTKIVSQVIYLIVVIIAGQGIIKHGIKSLLKKEVKIELLVTIATVGAFLLGDGFEGASLMLLFFLAEYLENYSLDKSKSSLSKLVKLSPDIAIIKKEGKEIEVNVKDISIGDLVVVKPGDKIPIDGIIEKGATSVNQASITGESLAVSKKIDDEVYASTINEEGYIEIKAIKTSDDTIFSKIISLIKESEEKKAKVDLFIDKFSKYYTPSIIIISILVATIPYFIFNQPLNEWVYRALVLLVIACPCALAIATPVSMVSAITAGTKNGIIIKGGEYVEELAKIKAILFDKTGTLTEGNLEIQKITAINDFSNDDITEIACSLERKSKHPISKAFNEYQKNNNVTIKEVHNFESIAGKGLKGEINGETYYVGKEELFNYDSDKDEIINDIHHMKNKEKGKTTVIIGNKNHILGFISLTDKIRDDGSSTILQLKEKSIKTIMLTGDNSSTAKAVAENIGLDNYYPNLLPEDKVNIVEEVANEYIDVAMVGDGINDTPSLARANVGIAMGISGADVAVETADIVLMQDKISKVSYLINLAKKTMSIVKQNITVALSVKAVLAILGVIGYISLWEAVLIGDMGLTLAVIGNALRIGR